MRLGLPRSRAVCEPSCDLLRWLRVLVLEEPIRVPWLILLWLNSTLQVLGVRSRDSEILRQRGPWRHHNHGRLVDWVGQSRREARLIIYDMRHLLVVVAHSGVAPRCCKFGR